MNYLCIKCAALGNLKVNFRLLLLATSLHILFKIMEIARHTINVNGRLLELSEPQVMGIVNITPDSFFADSRKQSEQDIVERVETILVEGGSMVDVGACSTRPGAQVVSGEEERARLQFALQVIRSHFPDVILSVDTFRPQIARMAVSDYGVAMINDVGDASVPRQEMFSMMGQLKVPYILMSNCANMHDMLMTFSREVQQLHALGVKDIILDPGFGFGKTLDENYQVMRELDHLHALGLPLLAGISRKSMIYKALGVTPAEALNGTSVLHGYLLKKGVSIFRVHDVRPAVEAVMLMKRLG